MDRTDLNRTLESHPWARTHPVAKKSTVPQRLYKYTAGYKTILKHWALTHFIFPGCLVILYDIPDFPEVSRKY